MEQSTWTARQIDDLEMYYPTMNATDLAIIFQRPYQEIAEMAAKLQLKKHDPLAKRIIKDQPYPVRHNTVSSKEDKEEVERPPAVYNNKGYLHILDKYAPIQK